MHTGAMDRRTKAMLMLIVAILAVIAFGTGITLCIDWGAASSPPARLRAAALSHGPPGRTTRCGLRDGSA